MYSIQIDLVPIVIWGNIKKLYKMPKNVFN